MKNNYQDVLDQAMQSHYSVFNTGRTAASDNFISSRAYVNQPPEQAASSRISGRNQESGMSSQNNEPGMSNLFLTSINPN